MTYHVWIKIRECAFVVLIAEALLMALFV